MGLVSPNELFEAAKDMELDGRAPEENWEWVTVLAFMVYNMDKSIQGIAGPLMAKLYDMPLTDEEVDMVVDKAISWERP